MDREPIAQQMGERAPGERDAADRASIRQPADLGEDAAAAEIGQESDRSPDKFIPVAVSAGGRTAPRCGRHYLRTSCQGAEGVSLCGNFPLTCLNVPVRRKKFPDSISQGISAKTPGTWLF
jgi:hypothetical protein